MAEAAKTNGSHENRRAPPALSRLISLFVTLLPLLLLIPAFVLAAVSSSRNDWSYHDVYDPNLPDELVVIGTLHRSPFVECVLTATVSNVTTTNDTASSTTTLTTTTTADVGLPTNIPGDEPPADDTTPPPPLQSTVWAETCVRVRDPAGLCFNDPNATSVRVNSAPFCQQLSLAARLLFAGCALLAAALLVAAFLTALTLPQVLARGGYAPLFVSGRPTTAVAGVETAAAAAPAGYFAGPGNVLGLLAAVLPALGAAALLLGTLIASAALVVMQFPQGDWFISTGLTGDTSPSLFSHYGPWLLGQPGGLCATAAVLAAVASYATGFVWEGPRVAVFQKQHLE